MTSITHNITSLQIFIKSNMSPMSIGKETIIDIDKETFIPSLELLSTDNLMKLLKEWKEYQLLIEKEIFERI